MPKLTQSQRIEKLRRQIQFFFNLENDLDLRALTNKVFKFSLEMYDYPEDKELQHLTLSYCATVLSISKHLSMYENEVFMRAIYPFFMLQMGRCWFNLSKLDNVKYDVTQALTYIQQAISHTSETYCEALVFYSQCLFDNDKKLSEVYAIKAISLVDGLFDVEETLWAIHQEKYMKILRWKWAQKLCGSDDLSPLFEKLRIASEIKNKSDSKIESGSEVDVETIPQ